MFILDRRRYNPISLTHNTVSFIPLVDKQSTSKEQSAKSSLFRVICLNRVVRSNPQAFVKSMTGNHGPRACPELRERISACWKIIGKLLVMLQDPRYGKLRTMGIYRRLDHVGYALFLLISQHLFLPSIAQDISFFCGIVNLMSNVS